MKTPTLNKSTKKLKKGSDEPSAQMKTKRGAAKNGSYIVGRLKTPMTLVQIKKEIHEKNLEEKIKWFMLNYSNEEETQNRLEGEDLFALCIAGLKIHGMFSTVEEAVSIQVDHLNNLIRKYERGETKNGVTAITVNHYKKFLKYLESLKKNSSKDGSDEPEPTTFAELFYNDLMMPDCINVLREVDPPLIDSDCNYIGKSKSAFCVWMEEMQTQGIIKGYSDRGVYANLLPTVINRFSISDSLFAKENSRAEKKYGDDFETMLSKIKLKHARNPD